MSDAKEPSLTKAPPAGKLFPCEACGAKVEFDPRSRSLKCPYCGYETKIAGPETTDEVQERDFDEYASKMTRGESGTIAGRSSQVRCTGCGAMVLLLGFRRLEQMELTEAQLYSAAIETLLLATAFIGLALIFRGWRRRS